MDLRRRIIEAVQAGASAREAASAIKLIHRWHQEQSQMTPQRLIFLDETGAKTNQHGQAAGAQLSGATLARLGAVRSLGDDHICGRPAPSWLDGTDGAGWGDQRC
ncbi:MAG: hypothetical protein OXC09_02725 [Truepera sp.]|nr:hypothetical protein [Truepera sp.]